MDDRPLKIWASVALCEKSGRFHLYEDREDGKGYSHDLKPKGFETARDAERYIKRKDRIKHNTRTAGLD